MGQDGRAAICSGVSGNVSSGAGSSAPSRKKRAEAGQVDGRRNNSGAWSKSDGARCPDGPGAESVEQDTGPLRMHQQFGSQASKDRSLRGPNTLRPALGDESILG